MDSTYETSTRTNVTPLTENNFAQFEFEMTAFLDTRMLSRYIEATHGVAPAVDPSKPETVVALTLWEDKHRAVCGHLYRHLDASIQGEFLEEYQKKNAYSFWSALEQRFRTKRPGQRFQAMGDELNIKIGTGAVSWSSKLQSIVALSTTEAEYVAACTAGQELVWMRKFLEPLGYAFASPPRLSIDNQSAVQVARNPQHHGRMKHLDLRYHWLREMVERGAMEIAHISTDQMPADILTKALPRLKLDAARKMLGLGRSFSEFVPHQSLFATLSG